METYFRDLSQNIFNLCKDEEVILINIDTEKSHFSRFNHSKIRQAGYVDQQTLSIDLISSNKQCNACFNLTGDMKHDLIQATTFIEQLRRQLAFIPEDPFINYSQPVNNSRHIGEDNLPSIEETIDHITDTSSDLDLVGIYASGEISQGFANSLGQFNWHTDYSFNVDWSIYQATDKAIKQHYAGKQWSKETFNDKIQHARDTLPLLNQQAKTVSPGKYRVYLSPSAVHELFELLSWGGFGLKSHRTAQTPLFKMVNEAKTLHKEIHLSENHSEGFTSNFTQQGFIKPKSVNLIQNGAYKNCLNDHRSAKEYNETVNCSTEQPETLILQGGTLEEQDILTALDTGVYISNLWYCNYSDRNNARITGMTRFACLWVENGKPIAPISVMRFDESIFNIFGKNLIALTKQREHSLDASTYEKRSQGSSLLPGALVDNFTFTL